SRNLVACSKRVRKLYLSGRYFGCRRCHGLTYRSTQESDGRVYALLRGGLDLSALGDPGRMPITQLGIALRALTLEQKRLDRLTKRYDGSAGARGRTLTKPNSSTRLNTHSQCRRIAP